MSRLSNLLRQVETQDPQLAADLKREMDALSGRRAFGLNFERHIPETIELPNRPVRKGDKVRFLPKRRAKPSSVDRRVWRVGQIRRTNAGRVADLFRHQGPEDEHQTASRAVDDLVVAAEFRDPIYPGLVSTGKVERGGDRPFHTVINAENFHALQVLLYTHEGKVDAIYIDPPYNSRARDWKYNNDYVDKDDAYRHSKWLAMMERRLKLAKRLLNPECSVLIVTIDENEVHRLALLLAQIFHSSKIQMVTALINPAGASIIDQFSRVDEHLLFVHIGSVRPKRTIAETTPLGNSGRNEDEDGSKQRKRKAFSWESLQRSGGNSRRQDTKAKFFPIYIDEKNQCIVDCGDHLPEGKSRREVPAPPRGCVQQWPIKTDGSEACWQLSAPTFLRYLEEGRIRLGRKKRSGGRGISFLTSGNMKAISDGELVIRGRDANGALIVERSEEKAGTRVGKTMWTNGQYSATEHGSTLLRRFIPGIKFPYPKSLYAVEDTLRFYVGHKPNALVLDFFAGSGTTAHAVMRLNRQDNGWRKCILVTNNEVSAEEQTRLRKRRLRPGDPHWEALGICEFITKPRITAAVTGKTADGSTIEGDYKFIDEFPMADGFEENVEFFTMTYEAPRPVAHNQAFEVIGPLLWLRAGSQGRRIEKARDDFDVADKYAVLFDLDASQDFLAAVAEAESVGIAFIVTDDDLGFQTVCGELLARVEGVRLYESYLNNFAINTG